MIQHEGGNKNRCATRSNLKRRTQLSQKNDHVGNICSPYEIYIIKQDIQIYVAYSRLNGWTGWAKHFCGH